MQHIHPLAADKVMNNHLRVVHKALVRLLVAVLSSKIAVENNVIQKVFCKTIYESVTQCHAGLSGGTSCYSPQSVQVEVHSPARALGSLASVNEA